MVKGYILPSILVDLVVIYQSHLLTKLGDGLKLNRSFVYLYGLTYMIEFVTIAPFFILLSLEWEYPG